VAPWYSAPKGIGYNGWVDVETKQKMKNVSTIFVLLLLVTVPSANAQDDAAAHTASFDFTKGIEGAEWNVRLIPIPRGKHPGRDLRLSPEKHINYYLEHSNSFNITPQGLQFTVHPNDPVVRGDYLRHKDRSEIGRFGFGEGEEGQVVEYSIRAKVPEDFHPPTGRDFCIITQSHTQVDVDFPGGWTMFIGIDAQDRLMFTYGLNDHDPNTFMHTSKFSAPFGEWWDLKVRVYWSTTVDGWAEVWFGDRLVVPRIVGPNMPTSDSMEWKFGIYRGYNYKTTDSLIVSHAVHKVISGLKAPGKGGLERVKQKAQEAKAGVRNQTGAPEYPRLVALMKQVRPAVERGDIEGAESILDTVLGILEAEAKAGLQR